MKHFIMSLCIMSLLAGCAGKTPLQLLESSPLSERLVAHSIESLEMIDSEEWASVPATQKLSARACPEYIIAAQGEKKSIIADLRGVVALEGLDLENANVLKWMIEYQYGPGAGKLDQLKSLESRAIKLVEGYRAACLPLVIDDEKVIKYGAKIFGGL